MLEIGKSKANNYLIFLLTVVTVSQNGLQWQTKPFDENESRTTTSSLKYQSETKSGDTASSYSEAALLVCIENLRFNSFIITDFFTEQSAMVEISLSCHMPYLPASWAVTCDS